MQVWRVMGVLMTLAGAVAETSLALDLPVPCGRGQPGSTFQDWRFSTEANPASPEEGTHTYGNAEAAVTVGVLGVGWLDQLSGFGAATGYWDLGSQGNVEVSIPVRPGASRLVSVQVVQYIGGPYQYASVEAAGATFMGRQRQFVEAAPPLGDWWVDVTLWRVETAPATQTIVVQGATNGSVVDRVVVDTWEVERLCPTNLVLDADAGQCSRSNVSWTLPAADGCAVTNVACVPPPGATFPVGTTVVNCLATDADGHPAACAFSVTIEDPSAPPLLLSIRRLEQTNAWVEVRWPVTCASNVLEQSSGVAVTGGWATVGEPAQRVGNEYRVITRATEGMRFYRLKRP
jgi:hypothetical protein